MYLGVVKDEEPYVGEFHADAHGYVRLILDLESPGLRAFKFQLERGAEYDMVLSVGVANAKELDGQVAGKFERGAEYDVVLPAAVANAKELDGQASGKLECGVESRKRERWALGGVSSAPLARPVE
jgi:hypothetical protein